MSVRVLVTGAGGDSAQGVIRALRKSAGDYIIASVCINEHSPGLFMSDIHELAPAITLEKKYVEFLVDFIKRHVIDVFIPTIDGEIFLISRYRYEIEQRCNVKIIIGSESSVGICVDKLEASKYLSSIGVNQPLTMTADDKDQVLGMISEGKKIIMKPRFGGGSTGIRILNSESLKNDTWLSTNNIYQHFDEYRKEFTAVVMKDDSVITAIAVLERILAGGRTVWCKRVAELEYEEMLSSIASGLNIPYINIQFGLVDNDFHVFDLNPRFSGSTGVFSEIFNGPHLLVNRFLHNEMPPFECSDEYFESVRYLDDLIYNRYEN